MFKKHTYILTVVWYAQTHKIYIYIWSTKYIKVPIITVFLWKTTVPCLINQVVAIGAYKKKKKCIKMIYF